MTAPDAESIDQLIDDCTAIPAPLRTARAELAVSDLAPPWSVTEECAAQVTDLDEFV